MYKLNPLGVMIVIAFSFALIIAAAALAFSNPLLNGADIVAAGLVLAAGFLWLRLYLTARHLHRLELARVTMHTRQGELNHRPARRASADVPPSWCWDDVKPTFDCD